MKTYEIFTETGSTIQQAENVIEAIEKSGNPYDLIAVKIADRDASHPSAVQAEALYTLEDMMNVAGWMAAADCKRLMHELKEEAEVYISKIKPASLSAPQDEGWVKEISEERKRQDAKWGEQNHAPADWLMILGEEVGEVNKAALEAKFGGKTLQEYREELIQVASVAVAMIQCFDRNSPPNS